MGAGAAHGAVCPTVRQSSDHPLALLLAASQPRCPAGWLDKKERFAAPPSTRVDDGAELAMLGTFSLSSDSLLELTSCDYPRRSLAASCSTD